MMVGNIQEGKPAVDNTDLIEMLESIKNREKVHLPPKLITSRPPLPRSRRIESLPRKTVCRLSLINMT